MALARAAALSRWERAGGLAIGQDDAPPLPPAAASPRAELERAVEAALRRPPCVVSFSGGRDSSAMLALALKVARERALPEPVPVSLRFPGIPETDEARWQERVIAHLEPADWERVEIAGELDFVGPLARTALAAHGHLWPPNTHFHEPVFARAAGGSCITGFDGDGLFESWRWEHVQSVLHGLVARGPRDVLRVGLALAPAAVRRWYLGRGAETFASWLRPDAARRLTRTFVAEMATEPRRWDRRIAHFWRGRFLRLPIHSLRICAQRHGAQAVHPLADPAFLAAVAAAGGAAGYGDRTAAMRRLFADLLPDDILRPHGKAEFGFAFWGEDARRFAAGWNGEGVDPELVDADALRATWAEPNPPIAAATLLQGAWLASRSAGAAAPAPPAGSPAPEAGTA